MKEALMGILIILVLGWCARSFADTLNPCEYSNVYMTTQNQLDTAPDPNFERIKQQNNQKLIIACQEYYIKKLNTQTNDLNRDNY